MRGCECTQPLIDNFELQSTCVFFASLTCGYGRPVGQLAECAAVCRVERLHGPAVRPCRRVVQAVAAPTPGVDADPAAGPRGHQGRQRRPEPHPSSDRIWLRNTLQEDETKEILLIIPLMLNFFNLALFIHKPLVKCKRPPYYNNNVLLWCNIPFMFLLV